MKTITALEFRGILSGSKYPCLFLCSDDKGDEFEVVVKFREAVSNGVLGLVSEAICARLGTALGLSVPESYLVDVRPQMGEFISQPAYSQIVNASNGINFGSRMVRNGSASYPFPIKTPGSSPLWTKDVFAFDFLNQNFDRQENNHNLLFDGHNYYLIDHEQALGRIYRATVFQPSVWDVDPFYVHVFYQLLDMATDWSTLYAKLRNISIQEVDQWLAELPKEWLARTEEIGRLRDYFRWLQTHLDNLDETMKSMVNP